VKSKVFVAEIARFSNTERQGKLDPRLSASILNHLARGLVTAALGAILLKNGVANAV
jgi:hypothetical protein